MKLEADDRAFVERIKGRVLAAVAREDGLSRQALHIHRIEATWRQKILADGHSGSVTVAEVRASLGIY